MRALPAFALLGAALAFAGSLVPSARAQAPDVPTRPDPFTLENGIDLERVPGSPAPTPDLLEPPADPPGREPATADGSDEPADGGAAASPAPPDEPPTLDALFSRLKREADPDRAEAIAREIQAAWLRSGSATVDLLMGWAAQAIARGDHGAAFDLLEQAAVLAPDYAEAWNARATLNFQLDRYGRSLADIERTLAHEPRHFGALAGLGAILEATGRQEAALEAYMRALAVYPALRPAQDAVGRLSADLAGRSL